MFDCTVVQCCVVVYYFVLAHSQRRVVQYYDVSSIHVASGHVEKLKWCEMLSSELPVSQDTRVDLLGFSPPGYEVFAEADAQGLTDSTPGRKAALQNKHHAYDTLGL